MESVQHADTSRGRGSQAMSDTDITTYDTGRMTRPSALGDLRFAGTIAAGLVAGTLGLGALAAPLVGWKDWPSALQGNTSAQSVRLATPKAPPQREGARDGRQSRTPAPRSETPLTLIGLPGGSAGTGTGTGTGTGVGVDGATGLAVFVGGGTPSDTSGAGTPERETPTAPRRGG